MFCLARFSLTVPPSTENLGLNPPRDCSTIDSWALIAWSMLMSVWYAPMRSASLLAPMQSSRQSAWPQTQGSWWALLDRVSSELLTVPMKQVWSSFETTSSGLLGE